MASNAQGESGSGVSSSKRGSKNVGKAKARKVSQRRMGIAQLEELRIQSQMAAAARNDAARNVVFNNLHNVPVYQLLDEGPRVNDPSYLSSLLASVPPSSGHTLLKEDDMNKKARTDSSSEESAAAAAESSVSQEPNLELRLFF